MALVECEGAGGLVAVGEHDQRAVDESELEVRVSGLQVSDRRIIVALQAFDAETSRGEVREERSPSRGRKAPPEQVVDLGRRRGGDDESSLLVSEGVQNRVPTWLVGVRERDQWPGVDQQRQLPKPSSSTCSGICEIERGSSSVRVKPAASAKSRYTNTIQRQGPRTKRNPAHRPANSGPMRGKRARGCSERRTRALVSSGRVWLRMSASRSSTAARLSSTCATDQRSWSGMVSPASA